MLTIKRVLCDNKKNPIGIDSKVVKMSWLLESSNRNVKQLAYQLQVAKDRDFEIIMFDSRKVETDQSLHIPINSFSYRAETGLLRKKNERKLCLLINFFLLQK